MGRRAISHKQGYSAFHRCTLAW